MQYLNVLSPIKVGNLELRNRFIVPSMGTGFPSVMEGDPDPKMVGYWGARAKGGFALCIVEYAYVNQIGKGNFKQLGIYDDDKIKPLSAIVNEIHKYGAKASLQIHHAGRNAYQQRNGNPYTVAPTALPDPSNRQIPHEMSNEEIYQTIEDYGDAAVRAKKAGFDAVEIHSAHGYLPGSFMSRNSNRRTDEFGGDIASRTLFAQLIIKNIKKKCGSDFTVGIRISGEERIPDGIGFPETCVIAQLLEEAGADYISVSIGTHSSQKWSIAPSAVSPGFNVFAAAKVKQAVSIPVVAVGRINTPELAEEVIRSGSADLIALGRESLADPEFPKKVMEGRTGEISPCVSCLLRCQGQFPKSTERHASEIHGGCMINPISGKETVLISEGKLSEDYEILSAPVSKKVAVVGGGPGGMEAAWIAAKRGHSVTLYEKTDRLGGQYRTASLPPYKQDIARALKFQITMCRKYGVNIQMNREVTAEFLKESDADVIILATGGVPLKVNIPGIDGEKVVFASDVLEGKVFTGDKCLVIGGGMVGMETADHLTTCLRKVTVVEMLSDVGQGENPATKAFQMDRMRDNGVQIITNCKVTSISDTSVTGEINGQVTDLGAFDNVILAMGSRSYNPLEEELKECGKEVYAIGDAVKARRALEAIYEGAMLALDI